jgi:putative methyltransferase (TIGR04325 family)
LREAVRGLIPPFLLQILRRIRPRKPQFSGVYRSAEDVPDDNPWESEEWLAMSRRRLAQARDSGSPQPVLLPGQLLTVLLLNLLTDRDDCSVLDFAGGSGWVYYQIHPFLAAPERVSWQVSDNARLAELGALYRRPAHRLEFLAQLPDPPARYDVVHINSSLHYVMDYAALISRLLAYAPRYVILTRLLAGPIETYVTCQHLLGRRTACVMINLEELLGLFRKQGYHVVFQSPASEEPCGDHRYHGIAPSLRLPHAIHVILAREADATLNGATMSRQ